MVNRGEAYGGALGAGRLRRRRERLANASTSAARKRWGPTPLSIVRAELIARKAEAAAETVSAEIFDVEYAEEADRQGIVARWRRLAQAIEWMRRSAVAVSPAPAAKSPPSSEYPGSPQLSISHRQWRYPGTLRSPEDALSVRVWERSMAAERDRKQRRRRLGPPRAAAVASPVCKLLREFYDRRNVAVHLPQGSHGPVDAVLRAALDSAGARLVDDTLEVAAVQMSGRAHVTGVRRGWVLVAVGGAAVDTVADAADAARAAAIAERAASARRSSTAVRTGFGRSVLTFAAPARSSPAKAPSVWAAQRTERSPVRRQNRDRRSSELSQPAETADSSQPTEPALSGIDSQPVFSPAASSPPANATVAAQTPPPPRSGTRIVPLHRRLGGALCTLRPKGVCSPSRAAHWVPPVNVDRPLSAPLPEDGTWQRPPRRVRVHGSLTDATTGQPVRRAYIAAVGAGGTEVDCRASKEGTFAMRVPVGEYDLCCQVGGYEELRFPMAVSVADTGEPGGVQRSAQLCPALKEGEVMCILRRDRPPFDELCLWCGDGDGEPPARAPESMPTVWRMSQSPKLFSVWVLSIGGSATAHIDVYCAGRGLVHTMPVVIRDGVDASRCCVVQAGAARPAAPLQLPTRTSDSGTGRGPLARAVGTRAAAAANLVHLSVDTQSLSR